MSKATPLTDALAFEYQQPKVRVDWFELGGVMSEQKHKHVREFLLGFTAGLAEDNVDLASTIAGIIDDHYPEGS